MQLLGDEHLDAAALEAYSLQRLDTLAIHGAECHLLVCADCCDRLKGIEPFSTIHYTQDGPFYSRVTQLRDGSFWAHNWGYQIHGGWQYSDVLEARKYLVDSFVQMFPEHECGKACGGTTDQHADIVCNR